MPSLEIYNSTAANFTAFITNLTSFITKDDFALSDATITAINIKDVNNNAIKLDYTSTAYSNKIFKFTDFYDDATFIIHAGRLSTDGKYNHSIQCIPIIRSYNYEIAFYSDENKVYTEFKNTETVATTEIVSGVYSNFRAMKYATSGVKFLSLGTAADSITISTFTFESIDDPTVTKSVLVITDSDGYVSLYDSYTVQPWAVHTTYHNGNNIGKTSSINAYKYSMKGYQCDKLYYFDGAYSMPGEGVSTIGGIKFLKLGNSNLFIKMD